MLALWTYQLDQVAHQVWVDAHELACEHAARVHVRRVRLEALVVAEDLRGRGGWHRREEQRVARSVLLDVLAKALPVVALGRGLDAPEVELELAF